MKYLVALAVLGGGLIGGVAQAETKFDRVATNVLLLQNKKVQTEIGITTAQRDKMNVAAQAHQKSLMAYEQEIRKAGRDPQTVGPTDPKIKSIFEVLRGKVLAVLRPGQIVRLREITLQASGISGLADENVAREVGINGATLAKIRSALDKSASEIRAIQQGVATRALAPFQNRKAKNEQEQAQIREQAQTAMRLEGEKAGPQVQKISNNLKTTIMGYLTAAQRTKWNSLQGKPFKP